MKAALNKPMIYSEIESLTVKMEKDKEKVRNLIDEALRITRTIHSNKVRNGYVVRPM